MPKSICAAGGRLRSLAAAAKGSVLTDMDAFTFQVCRRARGLPGIHRLLLDSDGFSLGYTQREAKGHPSDLYFVDPSLRIVGTVRPADACTSFVDHCGRWVVACREGGIHCFSNCGDHLWTWEVPRARHFESPVFSVVAAGGLILAAEGLYLYALTPHGHLLWDWELPRHHEQTHRFSLPFGGVQPANQEALHALGLMANAGPGEVRQAFRRMARLTHPDVNPGDPTAADRFRAVRAAYEALLRAQPGAGAGDGGIQVTVSLMINGRPVTARITALSVADNMIGVGTSEGEVYLCDLDGEVLTYHGRLGRQCVASVLLRDGGLDAAFCPPHLYRFDGGATMVSEDVPEFATSLVSHGDDVLAWAWKTLWLFDGQARLQGSMALDRRIDGVCASRSDSVVLAGHLFAIPHR